MPAKMNISLTGDVFTDELHTDVGAAAFRLNHDWFIDLIINTAAGGGGINLVLGVDYTLSIEDTNLSERVTDELGISKQVWGEVTIINAIYQAGDLYFSGKYIADSIEAGDVAPPNVLVITGADYLMLDNDDYDEYWFDPDGADRTFAFADPAVNENKTVRIRNIGDGTYKITLGPFDTEDLVVYSGNEAWGLASFELLQAGDWADFQSDGTNWVKVNAPYWHKVNNPITGWKASKTTGWTVDQFTPGGLEVTFSTAPLGALAIKVNHEQATTISTVYYRKSGDSNISNTPNADAEKTHFILRSDNTILQEIWLSSTQKAEYAVLNVDTDLYISYPAEYFQ